MSRERANAKKRASTYFARFIRSAGRCARCGDSSGPFEAAHLVPRRYSRTRVEQDNCACLCKPCHLLIDSVISEKVRFAHGYIGAERFEELERIARDDSLPLPDWPDEADKWRELCKAVDA